MKWTYIANDKVARRHILLRILEVLENDDFEVRKEASWVVSNICTGGSAANIEHLVEVCCKSVFQHLTVSNFDRY